MKTLILFLPSKAALASSAKVVRIVDTASEAKAILKDQVVLKEIFKEHPAGGQLLIVPQQNQREVLPVTHFVVQDPSPQVE